ncbi:hypothetical protein GCM10023322_77660 [Rugosimonospora acidiphila]|uniref:Uncharacterized protein n=1 Tax=Rugosimonospora acidiphila TaxID=556531 RepID=A0ABP9SPE9_9ACTN
MSAATARVSRGPVAPPASGGVDDRELGVTAGAIAEPRHGHGPITTGQVRGSRSDLIDHAGHVVPEDAGRGQSGPTPVPAVAGVDGVHPGRVHGDADLAGTCCRVWKVGRAQLMPVTESVDEFRLPAALTHWPVDPSGYWKTSSRGTPKTWAIWKATSRDGE